MHASASRIHPQQMPEPKILPQRLIDDLYRQRREDPALWANLCLLATRPHVIIVGQIDIEDQLLGDGAESALLADGLAIARVERVLGPDLEADGRHLQTLFAEGVGGGEGLVADVGVVGEDEGEFAVHELGLRRGGGVEPEEEGPEGEEALVKG